MSKVDVELLLSQAKGTDLEPGIAAIAELARDMDMCAVCLAPDSTNCEECDKKVCPEHYRTDVEGVTLCVPCWDHFTQEARTGKP